MQALEDQVAVYSHTSTSLLLTNSDLPMDLRQNFQLVVKKVVNTEQVVLGTHGNNYELAR